METTVDLNSGSKIPIIGLGTFKITGAAVRETLDTALCCGYRLIDTARVYRNEAEIGASLKDLLTKHSCRRSDLFITSKLGPGDHGAGRGRAACLASLAALGLDHLDLCLVHWPGVQGMRHDDPRQKLLRMETWRDLEAMYDEGVVKAIGVSNYTQRHLEELLQACRIKPAVLQTEYHPHLILSELRSYCLRNDIKLQAYSSLGTTNADNKLLTDPVVIQKAVECNRSPAQILLRWAMQQNIGVIPKATKPQHIRENLDSFSFALSNEQMNELNSLDKRTRYCWDPTNIA